MDQRYPVASELIALARQIAINRSYAVLAKGLQPLKSYTLSGVSQPGLEDKWNAEREELSDAQMNGKEYVWLLSEAADMLYYAACIDEVGETANWQQECYQDTLVLLNSPRYQISQEEAEASALAKYRLRASLPYRKHKEAAEERQARENAENAAILQAVQALKKDRWPGWTLTEVSEMWQVPVQTLHSAHDKKLLRSRESGKSVLIDIQHPRSQEWHAGYQIKQARKRLREGED